jgi:hypothetical protein
MSNIKTLLENHGLTPFRAGTSHGGEYHSACPGCGDGSPRTREQGPSDRFQIWPEKPEGVVYYCRKCGAHGDCIQFLRDFEAKSYHEACAILGITPSGNNTTPLPTTATPRPPMPKAAPTFAPSTPDLPSEAWMNKATEFAAWCHQQLLTSPDALRLLAWRGLTLETARRYWIGYNPGENNADLRRARKAWGLPDIKTTAGKLKALWLPRGLVMPVTAADGRVISLRIRRRPEDVAAFAPERTYQVIDGSCHATLLLEPEAQAFVVTESGLDAYLCAQEGQGLTGAASTWNSTAKPDAAACAALDQAMRILVALDNDAPGAKASLWWLSRFPQARRWPLPLAVGKDPGEVKTPGYLRKWLAAGLPPVLTIFVAPVQDVVDLVCETGEGAEIKAEPVVEQAEWAGQSTISTPDTDLADLAALLAAHPVQIFKTRNNHEVSIKWKPAWRDANRATATRISDLVFKSESVTLAIHRHPAMVIHGGNLIQG